MITDQNTILIIDTAMQACNIGLYKDKQTHAAVEKMAFGQAEKLMPAINSLLETQECSYQDLSNIIVTTGPGGFTGLRVGISSARALALALNIPLFGITNFTALAATHAGTQDMAIILDSKREELFYQNFNKDASAKNEPKIAEWNNITENLKADTSIITNLETKENNPGFSAYPDLEKVMAYALKNPSVLEENPEPLYMRDADISKPKKQYRKLKA